MPNRKTKPRPRSFADAFMGVLGMTLLILFVRTLLTDSDVPPQTDVYAICEPCGLTRPKIDELRAFVADTIDRVTREEMFALFDKQLDDPAAAQACRPCAETIIDAVNKPPFVP